MTIAFVINARQKEKFVGRAVQSALEQTVPCEIILSYQESTDNTLQVMIDTAKAFGPCHHKIKIVKCPIRGAYGMKACNAHFRYAWQQTSDDCDWIYQLSADDYSLPDRVKVCDEAVRKNSCSAVACTMFFENPGAETRQSVSGYPQRTGYVDAAEGLMNLAYGSVITGYSREFLKKMDDGGANTLDVYYGFLAALDKGFYVVKNEQHVHMQHADAGNMGFQGKMRNASGDESLRLAELNHFQLLALYDHCFIRAGELHPEGIPRPAYDACLNILFGQAKSWLEARKVLHANNIVPGTLP